MEILPNNGIEAKMAKPNLLYRTRVKRSLQTKPFPVNQQAKPNIISGTTWGSLQN
jgi:hypothetical protein